MGKRTKAVQITDAEMVEDILNAIMLIAALSVFAVYLATLHG